MSSITPTILIAGLIATAVPLIVLYIIYTLDFYKTGAFWLILLSFVWGFVAFFIAARLNTWMINRGLPYLVFKRFSAPIVEEILKALILIYLVRRPNFTYFVDGAIYGFAVGIGFAIVENYSYIIGNPGAELSVAVSRVISTNLIHASASGMVGITMGLARFQRFSGRLGFLLLGLAAAMGTHMGFNNLVTSPNLVIQQLVVVFAAFTGAVATGLIVGAIRRGLKEERAWIEQELGMADRVTEGEAAVVHQITDMKELLAPIAAIFPDKISQIEDFLLLQARLGIRRGQLQDLTDEKMIAGVRAEMDKLRAEMDAARRAVGYGAMIYVRSIFPDESSSLWGQLTSMLEEQEESAISVAELIEDLPHAQRAVMRLLLGASEQTLSHDEMAQRMAASGEINLAELDNALALLARARWVIRHGENPVRYKANLRRRGSREVPVDIWASLGDRTAKAGEAD